MKTIVKLVARHELGPGADKRQGVSRRGTCRHDDKGIWDLGFGIRGISWSSNPKSQIANPLRERPKGVSKRVQVRDADQPRPARSDHLSCGGCSNVWMSDCARAPSISAPAAADEASQARAMSLASVASRRTCAAWLAS